MAIGFVGQLGGAGGSAGAAAAIDYGAPVQDLTELRAVPPALRGDKQQRLVEDENAEYRFDATGVGADDGDLIIQPDTGSGRWFKITPTGGIPTPHDLGGVSHTADTLANLNTKVSDATLLNLAGQLGGTAAAPDVRGIRETGGPTLLTAGAVTDGQFTKRSGSTLIGSTPREIKIVTGSLDVTAASGDIDHNIVAALGIVRIRRAWLWISANGADIGANTQNDIIFSFFATDAFVHFIDNANPNTDGRVAAFPEFQHVVQDVATAIIATDTVANIDDGTLYAAEMLIRLFKTTGPTEEFQRIDSVVANALTIKDTMQNAFALDDDVALVQELGGFDYEDQDVGADEIHMKISPDTGKDDFRLRWVFEIEVAG